MTKLEEMARALHRSYHGSTMEGLSGGSAEAAWDRDAAYGGNDEWLAQARAALAVLREPSEAQVRAMTMVVPTWDDVASRAKWQAGVDAILNETDVVKPL